MKLYVFKHFIVCSVLALSKTTNSAIQTSIIKLSVLLYVPVDPGQKVLLSELNFPS